MPESSKSTFKKSTFVCQLQTGPKLNLDGTTLWTPKPMANEAGKDVKINFTLKGITAPSESLKGDKKHPVEESKEAPAVDDQKDKDEIRKLKRSQLEKDREFEKERERIIDQEKKKREDNEITIKDLKRQIDELKEVNKLAVKDNTQSAETMKILETKNKKIEELEKEIQENKTKKSKKSSDKARSESPSEKRHKSRPKTAEKESAIKFDIDKESDDLNRRDTKFKETYERTRSKETIIKQGLDTEDVMKLIKTVVESTQKGVPLETNLLGVTGANAQQLPKDLIKDILELQTDKINFVGSLGGTSVLQSNELSRRDKINLLKLGMGKGLFDKDTEAKLLASEPSLEKELSDPRAA